MPKVAYQGIPGANSEIAVRQHFGDDVEPHPCQDFINLFSALQADEVEFSLLPVENALAGSVSGAYELLLDHDVRIQAEVILHVSSCPACEPGHQARKCHNRALASASLVAVRALLAAATIWSPVSWYDTAGAAKDLSESPQPGVAVIAPKLAGELYGLDLLASDIEDERFNYTRFFGDGAWRPRAVRLQTRHRSSSPLAIVRRPLLRVPGRIRQARLKLDQAGIAPAPKSTLGTIVLS